ncbi:TonB-dependent receptor [Echinimonas agarilytica]|uniref:TonB-dependent receptor n=1 Tax=Echinimonas agarilytica TaxID=1215918 RepID=A0AA41W3U7_9GAMM|nr:TonB-dependent receptor [Echinimonas agarilytica]MCM2678200.1 TonB-dependent receptor [Echinimonas agarilytica]
MNNLPFILSGLPMKPLALACMAIFSANTMAEVPAVQDDNEQIEHILVIGQAASTSKSLQDQRDANNLITVATADAIGNFPDANASESLQRMVGLSIERDQGEGRFVRVRGLAPDYNAVTINGTRVPSPEAGRRAVALDVVPSDLIQTLTVTKSLTPDMDADSLGGAVDIKSTSAFDRDGMFYKFNAEGGYNDLEEEYSPKITGAYSNTFADDTVGIAMAASWLERKFGSDNVETGGGWDFDEDPAILEELEQRDYQITRERLGLAANFDWRPSDSTTVYLRTLYSEFSDEEQRNAIVTEWEDGTTTDGSVASTEVTRELKDREETQTISSIVLGAEHVLDAWKLDYQIGWSQSEEDNPDYMVSKFEHAEGVDLSVQGSSKPRIQAQQDYYDYDAYELDEIEVSDSFTEDTEHNVRFNVARELDWDDAQVEVKFGVKMSRRDKDNREDIWVLEDLDEAGIADEQLLMSANLGSQSDYSLGDFGRTISANSIRGLAQSVGRHGYEDDVESRINDFDVAEDVDAGYVMATVTQGDMTVIGGLRYESTDFEAKGWRYNDIDETFTERKVSNDYDHWLPSLQMRYNLNQDMVIRAAWTNSIVRPTFEQLAPGFVMEESDGDIEVELGNPELEALESMNLDLAFEYYMGESSLASVGVFYKDIENFVYGSDLAGSPGYEDFDKAETYANGDSADLYGIELNWVKQMDELPAPWSGLLLSANGTYTDSDADISYYDDGERLTRSIPFPSQSDKTANFAIGYEDQDMSLRLSAAYKSKYLLEVDKIDDETYDVYEDDHVQLDFIAKAYVADGIQVYFNALNLTDEAYYTYAKSSRYNVQHEEYGRSFQLGVTVSGL